MSVCSEFKFNFLQEAMTGKFHFHNVKLVFKMSLTLCLQNECINSLPTCLRLVAWLLTCERNKAKQDKWVNQSKRKIAYYKRQLAQNIAKCHEISLEISQRAATYHHANNRSPEMSSKYRSKRKFAYFRRIFAEFVESRLHYFGAILYQVTSEKCVDSGSGKSNNDLLIVKGLLDHFYHRF